MSEWTWQKWVGKLAPLVIGLGGLVWSFIEAEPQWWPLVVGGVTGVVQWVVAIFPAKA